MSVVRGYRTSEELRKLYDQFGREDREQLDEDVKAVLRTAPGRRVLMAILCKEHVFGTIGESGESTNQAMIEVGRHNLAQDILTMANHADCDAVASAMKERNDLLRERNRRIAKVKERMEEER